MSTAVSTTLSKHDKPKLSNESVPGPGAYETVLPFKENSPKWSLGTEKRYPDIKPEAPGPGKYEVQEKGKDGIGFPLAHRAPLPFIKNPDAPGPGKYDVPLKASRSQNGLSFGIKLKEKNSSDIVPGPGAYLSSTLELLDKKSAKFSHQTKDIDYTNEVPGPGEYKLPAINPGAAASGKYSFGTSRRINHFAPKPSEFIPGPGAYATISSIGKGKGRSISPPIKDKNMYNQTMEVPGPGSYSPLKHSYSTSSRIGNAKRFQVDKLGYESPGPAYTTNELRASAPSWVMGTSKRSDPFAVKSQSPGPGKYSLPSKIQEGPFVSVKSKIPEKDAHEVVPGPGAYSPNNAVAKPKQPCFKIGSDTKFYVDKTTKMITPGPGIYPEAQAHKGPAFSVGTSGRTKQFINDSPGPGNYEAPSEFNTLTHKGGIKLCKFIECVLTNLLNVPLIYKFVAVAINIDD